MCTHLSDKPVKRRYSLTLTEPFITALDTLVEIGLYLDQQVAIRSALRRLFRYHRIEPFYSDFFEEVEKEKD